MNKGSAAVAARLPADSVGIELGVWKGDTSARFLATGKVSHLHLVDAWNCNAMEMTPGWRERYAALAPDGRYQDAYDHMFLRVKARFGGDGRVTVWRMTTAEFFAQWPKGARVDWVYVDASHEYNDVLFDLTASARVANVIFGDDYGNKPGVTAAVRAWAEASRLPFEVFAGNQYRFRTRR